MGAWDGPPAGRLALPALATQGGEGGITMKSSVDRRHSHGRRRSDGAARGLLHDLGHQMTTLSYLVEAVRGDVVLPDDSGFRMELLSMEMTRMLDIIGSEIPDTHEVEDVSAINLGALTGQVTQLAGFAHEASVILLPGPLVGVEASAALLWRVLTNVVDNAARAAGPDGQVEVDVREEQGQAQGPEAVIEITDDGPGFGSGPPGTASLGLGVVSSLLESCGGRIEVQEPEAGGTRVRIVIPVRASPAAPPAG
jgi:signal transduction histidine kinase